MELKSFVIGIIICFFLACAIGLERQFRRRFIGLRTTVLVAIGAYMFVSMSFIIGADKTDLTRIAAGIVSGISFLGAGVIIKNDTRIQGLTTAATLWCDAAIGVLCATGAYYEALIGTVIIIIVNVFLRAFNISVDKRVNRRNIRENYEISVSIQNGFVKNISNQIKRKINDNNKYEIEIDSIKYTKNKNSTQMEILLSIKGIYNEFIDELVSELTQLEEISKVEYKNIGDFFESDKEF